MWLWKIASATPDVTATDAPTTTCPPTGLALSTDAKDAAKLNLAYEIDQSTGSDGYPTSFKFELYRSSSLAGFCDADDDDGGPDPGGKGCVATVTKEVTVTSPLTSASFDTLKQGSWYRARGRGCVNAACGSWSAPIYAYLMEPWPGLGPPPSLNLSMARVAGDGIVGTGEKAAGFPISGSAQPGASVDLVIAEVTGGASGASATTTLPTVTVGADGTWSVQVPASISSTLSDGDYTVRATVTKGGVTATLTRTFVVDTTAPSVTYTAPATLTVGTAVSVSPSTTDADKSQHRYALASGSTLPPGLSLAASTGAISGTPTTARSTTRSVTIVVTDRAGNTQNVALTFPAVGSAPPPTPTPQQCSLTVTATTGGTASGSWSGNCGTTRSISATANSGYEFSNWSGAASGTSASTSVVVNQASMTATANFTRQCSLTVTAGTGGTVTPSATVTVDCGTSVSISASVDPGYRFKNWSGAASGTSLSTTVVVNQTSMTATANFQRQHTLSVTTAGGCGSASGGDTYDKGTVVTVTATEGANCKFANWFGGGLTGVTSTTATITMNSDKWTLAIFKRKRTLTTSVSPPGGGSVSASPSGPYYHGDSVTLTASSSTVVFWFTHWSGDCSGSSSSCSLTMNGNRSVTAHFTHNCDGNTGIGCSVQPQGQRPP